MDCFGIGSAIMGAVLIYFRSARGAGRTTALINSVKSGDRIVFGNHLEAKRVEQLCKEQGIDVDCIVVDVNQPQRIFERGISVGRTILDHTWVENYYLKSIENIQKQLDELERETSGYGIAHVETKYAAKELSKWRF